jgi:hypothetical protein
VFTRLVAVSYKFCKTPCTGLEPATRWLTAYRKPNVSIGFCCLGKDFSGAIGPEIDGDPSRRRFTLSCAGPIELLRSCAPVKYLIQTLVDSKVRSCRVGRSIVGCKTIPIGQLERRLRFEHLRGLCRVATGAFG